MKGAPEEEIAKHQYLLEHMNIQLNWYGEFSDAYYSHYYSSLSFITYGVDAEKSTTRSTVSKHKKSKELKKMCS